MRVTEKLRSTLNTRQGDPVIPVLDVIDHVGRQVEDSVIRSQVETVRVFKDLIVPLVRKGIWILSSVVIGASTAAALIITIPLLNLQNEGWKRFTVKADAEKAAIIEARVEAVAGERLRECYGGFAAQWARSEEARMMGWARAIPGRDPATDAFVAALDRLEEADRTRIIRLSRINNHDGAKEHH